jgi:hypothetical protein
MAMCLNMLNAPVQWCLLRKGPRVFALLGKATSVGLAPFHREDLPNAWAVTSELGCLRLEHLSGEEEVTSDQIYLPTPFCYDFGITGPGATPETTRAIFGLLSWEVEELVNRLRQGSFPVLGFSRGEQRCGLTGCTIPGHWPHVVTSNLALYGNVVSLETFVRVLASSLPQGQLTSRFPGLQPIFKQITKMVVLPRRGAPYHKELVETVPGLVTAR